MPTDPAEYSETLQWLFSKSADWGRCLDVFYGAGEVLEFAKFKNVDRWVKTVLARPKTQAGMKVCAF